MIPNFNLNGVLPPFVGSTPGGHPAQSSPYDCSALEMVERFSTTDHRKNLLRGLFQFRQSLRQEGFQFGFQWIDGSFTEDVEATGRDPGDVDVLTLAYRPAAIANDNDWRDFIAARRNGGILDRQSNKQNFACDTVFLDLHAPPHLVARQAAYWNGLFSHRRSTYQWKGMIALALHADDADAIAALGQP